MKSQFLLSCLSLPVSEGFLWCWWNHRRIHTPWSRLSVNAPNPPIGDLQECLHQDPGIHAATGPVPTVFVPRARECFNLSGSDSRSANRWICSTVPITLSSRCLSCPAKATNNCLCWSCIWHSDASPLSRVSPTTYFGLLSATLKNQESVLGVVLGAQMCPSYDMRTAFYPNFRVGIDIALAAT